MNKYSLINFVKSLIPSIGKRNITDTLKLVRELLDKAYNSYQAFVGLTNRDYKFRSKESAEFNDEFKKIMEYI